MLVPWFTTQGTSKAARAWTMVYAMVTARGKDMGRGVTAKMRHTIGAYSSIISKNSRRVLSFLVCGCGSGGGGGSCAFWSLAGMLGTPVSAAGGAGADMSGFVSGTMGGGGGCDIVICGLGGVEVWDGGTRLNEARRGEMGEMGI